MKTHARYAYILTLILGPIGGCGDDSGGTGESTGADDGSSSAAESSTSTTVDPNSESSESSSRDAAESSSGGDDDPFADCSRDVLADDFGVIDLMGVPGPPRWYGPGAHEDGTLIDDGTTAYVVSSTYLALSATADLEAFSALNEGNAAALFSNPGLVAAQLGGSASCGTARTFTVWTSEAAMMEFVASPAHLQSVSAFPSLSRGGSTLSVWPETARASEIDWETALEHLGQTETYD